MKHLSKNYDAKTFAAIFSGEELTDLIYDWLIWARDDQLPPPDDVKEGFKEDLKANSPETSSTNQPWQNWLILGGRGAGKTRAGSEWVRAMALGKAPFASEPAKRIALVGETLGDVRRVMVEGVSGVMAIHPDHERPHFEPSKTDAHMAKRLHWRTLFS